MHWAIKVARRTSGATSELDYQALTHKVGSVYVCQLFPGLVWECGFGGTYGKLRSVSMRQGIISVVALLG